jgi:signal peptidase II
VWFLGLGAAVLAGDLWIKQATFAQVAGTPVVLDVDDPQGSIPPHEGVVVVPGVLSLRLTANTGAVFGMGKGGKWVFVAVCLIAAPAVLWWFVRSKADQWALHGLLALILGGALGNLYDRLRFGAVRDMFHLFPNTSVWPWIFNLADAALMVGVIGMVLWSWFNGEKSEERGAKSEERGARSEE